MVATTFLWGGFILARVWHLLAWQFVFDNDPNAPDNNHDTQLNWGLSGTALCAFGYLLFSQAPATLEALGCVSENKRASLNN